MKAEEIECDLFLDQSENSSATTTIILKQGDVNVDGVVSISDAVSVVNIILNNGEPE